jgi:hypothetical protein
VTSSRTVDMVVAILGAALLILVAGILVLVYQQKPVNDALITLAGGLVGSVGSLLVSTRSVSPAPTPEEATPEVG